MNYHPGLRTYLCYIKNDCGSDHPALPEVQAGLKEEGGEFSCSNFICFYLSVRLFQDCHLLLILIIFPGFNG